MNVVEMKNIYGDQVFVVEPRMVVKSQMAAAIRRCEGTIAAIKLVREVFGLSLTESRDLALAIRGETRIQCPI